MGSGMSSRSDSSQRSILGTRGLASCALVLSAALPLALGGCAATPPATVSAHGGTWDAVLPAPEVVQTVGIGRFTFPEDARNDAALAARDDSGVYPLGQWPAEPAPSAFRTRTLTIPTSGQSSVLFRTRYEQYRDNRWYGSWR